MWKPCCCELLILGFTILVHFASARNHRSEMAPYIAAIDAQHQSYCIVRCFCDILRIRWESTRSHTKQRALLMMDKLAVNFSDTEEFWDLQAYLDEIKKRLNATSSEVA